MNAMQGIQVVVIHDLPRQKFVGERIEGALLPETRFASASVNYVPADGAQTPHFQNRPQNGDEIVFVYAGRFRIVSGTTKSQVFDTDEVGPVYFLVASGTPATVENCGPKPVRFYSVFAPPFKVGEVQFLEPPGT